MSLLHSVAHCQPTERIILISVRFSLQPTASALLSVAAAFVPELCYIGTIGSQ